MALVTSSEKRVLAWVVFALTLTVMVVAGKLAGSMMERHSRAHDEQATWRALTASFSAEMPREYQAGWIHAANANPEAFLKMVSTDLAPVVTPSKVAEAPSVLNVTNSLIGVFGGVGPLDDNAR